MRAISRMAGFSCCLLATSLAVGCHGDQPDLGLVKGTVTLGGKPLPKAWVAFNPAEGGAPSYARTNEDGRYELIYSRQSKGAKVGEHHVAISTFVGEGNEEPPVPEMVPARYNAKTELLRTVKAGANVHDFDLEADERLIKANERKPPPRGRNP